MSELVTMSWFDRRVIGVRRWDCEIHAPVASIEADISDVMKISEIAVAGTVTIAERLMRFPISNRVISLLNA